jgi:hypothetical protein
MTAPSRCRGLIVLRLEFLTPSILKAEPPLRHPHSVILLLKLGRARLLGPLTPAGVGPLLAPLSPSAAFDQHGSNQGTSCRRCRCGATGEDDPKATLAVPTERLTHSTYSDAYLLLL